MPRGARSGRAGRGLTSGLPHGAGPVPDAQDERARRRPWQQRLGSRHADPRGHRCPLAALRGGPCFRSMRTQLPTTTHGARRGQDVADAGVDGGRLQVITRGGRHLRRGNFSGHGGELKGLAWFWC
uniref:Uncharacterized protein n=1 Tax=Arundo donax TaxID=35708 RepID=A0A0A9ART3_ARUDO